MNEKIEIEEVKLEKEQSYLSNPLLKRIGVEMEYTQEHLAETLKCAEDPVYFFENYIKIVTVDEGLVHFTPYEFQKEIVKTATENRFTICKMPRQTGKTTTVAALLCWYILFEEDFKIAILANKMAQAREILSRVQTAYENLPKWLQQGVREWNKGNIELENGSKILASATSSSAARGDTFNLVYMDELAFVSPNIQQEFFASVYPTIASGKTSKIVITSTPNGLEMFYRIWADSEAGKNSYKRVEVNWWDRPGYDEKWKEETIANTSEEQFRVEFECEFLGSADTLISGSTLKRLQHVNPLEGSTDAVAVYHEPIPHHLYTMCVDVSRGVNRDYSAFTVIDVTSVPYQIVARYKSNSITPQQFPQAIHQIALKYNEAHVMIEINDVGQQVADIFQEDFEYENNIYTSNKGRNGVQISSGFGGGTQLPGLRTTLKTKKIGCSNLKTLVENNKIILNDFEVINELSTFVAHGESYKAQQGKTDDLVMTLVMFGWMTTQSYFKNLTDTDYVQDLKTEKSEEVTQMMPVFLTSVHEDDEWGDVNYVL